MSISEAEYVIDSIKELHKQGNYYENCTLPLPPPPIADHHNTLQDKKKNIYCDFHVIIPDDVIVNNTPLFEVSEVTIYTLLSEVVDDMNDLRKNFLNRIDNGEFSIVEHYTYSDIHNSNRAFYIHKVFTSDEIKKSDKVYGFGCNFLILLKSTDGLLSFTQVHSNSFKDMDKLYQIKIEFDGDNTIISTPFENSMNYNTKPAKVIKSNRVSRTNRYFSYDTIEIDDVYKNAFFMPKPCIIDRDEQVRYLDPNDYRRLIDGGLSYIDNMDSNVNAMMEWKDVRWDLTFVNKPSSKSGGYYIFTIANFSNDIQYDENTVINLNYTKTPDTFYTAIFPGIINKGKLRSVGIPESPENLLTTRCSFDKFKSNAQNNCKVDGNLKCGIEDFYTRLFINLATLMVIGDIRIVNNMFASSVETDHTHYDNMMDYMAIRQIKKYNFKLGMFKDNMPDSDDYINGYNVFGMACWNPCSISYFLDGILYAESDKLLSDRIISTFAIAPPDDCADAPPGTTEYILNTTYPRWNLTFTDIWDKSNQYERHGFVSFSSTGLINSADGEFANRHALLPKLPFSGNLSTTSLSSYCCLNKSNTSVLSTTARMVYSKMYTGMLSSPTNRILNLGRVGSTDIDDNIIGVNEYTGARLFCCK